MAKRVIATDSAPAAVGPYSQAIESDGLLFCSGQVGLDPGSGQLIGETIEEQTQQVLENIAAVLEAAGAGFENVVKVNAYLTDMSDFQAFNEVYAGFFESAKPARATIGVASLPLGARVEVECTARM
jgi:2-iminobutanoate/2-iminopropanoate deaminase